jgi:hypothetical protein
MAPLPDVEDEDLDQTPEDPEPQYGPNNEDLPEQIVNALKSVIVEFQGHEKYTRRREVIHSRKLLFYDRGHQHITWSNQGNSFFIQSAGGMGYNSQGQQVQCPTYMDDFNIFQAFVNIVESVLTQNPPGVNFQPVDPSVPEDIDKAHSAEDYSHAWDRMNDRPAIQKQIVRMFCLSGRTVSWTRTEEDGQRFGYDEQGKPKKFQRTTIHGTLETKVPITAKEFDKDFLYCIVYDDPDVKVAKEAYPKIKKKIKAGTAALGENNYERTARLGVLNGSRSQVQIGDSYTHLVSRANVFLRPAAFEGELFDQPLEEPDDTLDTIKDEEEPDEEKSDSFSRDRSNTPSTRRVMTIREKLQQMFPHGCRSVWVGDTYAQSFAESMDDHVDVRFPYEGEGMFRMAVMDPHIVNQDFFNDTLNGLREGIDTGWPDIWFDSEDEDLDAVRSQRSAPNSVRGFKCRDPKTMAQSIYQTKMFDIPASLETVLQLLMGELPQFQLATPPAVFGASMEDQKTASGYAQARAQAMGRLGVLWGSLQRMFARIRYQAALCAANCDQQTGQMTIPAPTGGQPIRVDMDRLRKGNFGCYPDEDSSFPESTQQKRATVDKLIAASATNPAIAQLVNNPDNIATFKRYEGLDELVFLPAEARDKQLAEIEILISQEPIGWVPPEMMDRAQAAWQVGATQAQLSGMPAPPPPNDPAGLQPSVPIRPLDYDQWEGPKCEEWLSSKACRDEEAKGNFAGVANVTAHGMKHLARAAAKAQAMQATMGPPPPMVHKPAAPPPPAGGPPAAPSAPPAEPLM